MKGQTVNYNYDTSGNVVSKVVVQPQKTAVFNFEKDSIPALSGFLAYIPTKMPIKSEQTSNKQAKEPLKTSGSVNNKHYQNPDNNKKKEL